MRRYPVQIFMALLAVLCFFAAPNVEARDKRSKAEGLVRKSTDTLDYFTNSSGYAGLWDTADDAKAMVVIPQSYRGGFLFGGSGGNALLIVRNEDGSWSGPTFLTIGTFSFGLQAGGEVSELVLLVMTNRGKERLLSTSVKLGADITVAAGPVGAGAKAKTADVLAFSRSRGLYGGVSLEGTVLKTRRSWNAAYYGREVSTVDVVFRGVQDNPASRPLREAAYRLANRDTLQTQATNFSQNNPSDLTTQRNVSSGRVYNRPGVTRVQPTNGQPLEPQRPVYEDDQFYPEEHPRQPNRGTPLQRRPSP